MNMDPKYHCSKGHTFTVRGHVARDAQKTGRQIVCPLCSDMSTTRVGSIIRQRPKEPPRDAPPTEPQLNYIRALGGDTRKVKTLKDAGEYITRLKKLKGSSA